MAAQVPMNGEKSTLRELLSDILWSRPKLLAKSNVKSVQGFLIGVNASKNAWEMFLILKNLWRISDFSDLPPPEYEIPPGGAEMAMWHNECTFAWKQCTYHLFIEIYECIMTASKLFTGYYPAVWKKTAQFSTDMLPRALWFVTVDHAVTNVGRFFAKLSAAVFVAARHTNSGLSVQEEIDTMTKPREENVDSFSNFKDVLSAVTVDEMFSVTGLAWLMMLNQLLDVLFYQKLEFETSSYTQISKANLPGCNEIVVLASQMGFFKRDLLLELNDDAPPRATHYNFVSSDIIVITKSLLEKLPPKQSKSIVGLAMIHWKAAYSYWDHFGAVVFLCAKLYMCAFAEDLPSLFNFEEDVHPAVIHALLYATVFPVFDDIFYGWAGWVHTRQVFNCDKAIEDATSSVVYLKQALVRLAIYRGRQKFDGWYSSWFFGEPSLIGRITRIRRYS